MPRFKITYWPGTAQMSASESVAMSPEELHKIEKVAYCEAKDRDEAIRISAARYVDTSDGTLVEQID